MVAVSIAKQNYVTSSEEAVNEQIQLYQSAQYTYLAAAAYFNKADIALPVSGLTGVRRQKFSN